MHPLYIACRLLDEELPSMYISNTLHEPGVVFHKKIPKVGAYYAALLKADTGRPVAVLTADSLCPPGRHVLMLTSQTLSMAELA